MLLGVIARAPIAIRCGQPDPDEYGKTGSNEVSVHAYLFYFSYKKDLYLDVNRSS